MALILVINEEKDLLALTGRVLGSEGHRVALFNKIQAASEWLHENSPDLVIASAGRHGERAKEAVRFLKGAGMDDSRVLLLAGAEAFLSIRDVSDGLVSVVMQGSGYYEELIKVVNSALAGSKQ